MEFINGWNRTKPRKPPVAPAPSPESIRKGFEAFGAQVLTVHCYDDVDYRWVSVVWRTIIGPNLALRIGRVLADAVGGDVVHFNSLRPQAVTFVLGPGTAAEPSLPIGRYGVGLAAIEGAWGRAADFDLAAADASRS